jgi:hypothetical protein
MQKHCMVPVPFRAVEPLHIRLDGMANNNSPDANADVPPDEPFFILRADDPQAADLVRLWAEGRDFLHGSVDPSIAAARQCADAMADWCVRNDKEPVSALKLLPFEMLAAELRRRSATVTPGAYDADIGDGGELDS